MRPDNVGDGSTERPDLGEQLLARRNVADMAGDEDQHLAATPGRDFEGRRDMRGSTGPQVSAGGWWRATLHAGFAAHGLFGIDW